MTVKQDSDEVREILSIFRYRGEMTLPEILMALKNKMLKRTLQRRLQRLIVDGLVATRGKGRATVYYAVSAMEPIALVLREGQTEFLSRKAGLVRQHITKPLSQRQAVTYNRNFLYDYIPNQTFYLDAAVRLHLERIGKENAMEATAESFISKILDRLLVDLSWNSSRLEGNTYSLLETERLLDEGSIAEGKNLVETRMILNHKSAIEFLVSLGDDLGFNPYVIFNLHALLAKNLLSDSKMQGRVRTIPVAIGKTSYKSLAIPQLIEDYFYKILDTASAINDPFEQSFFAMVHIPYLQTFVDVNKRVSRLAANIPLIKNNLCPISFVDLPRQDYIDGILGVYELNNVNLLADVFVSSYEKSSSRYSEARAYLAEPNIFMEQHDSAITELIRKVLLQKLDKPQSIVLVNQWTAQHIKEDDRNKFIEVVQDELLALHLGSIAKFGIKPQSFNAWWQVWNKR